jgi:PAS domain S-box-containing protein
MEERRPAPTDFARRRKASTALSNSPVNADERYRLVMEAVAEGIYEWTTTTNRLELSARLTEMLGFKSGELTSANWVERVHPHDRPRYRDATIAYFKGHVRHFFCEYRIRNKSDEWCWVSDRATSIRDSDGRVLRLIGAIADISEMPTIHWFRAAPQSGASARP